MNREHKAELAVRLYVLVLRLYPQEFRERFEFELLEGFVERRRKAGRTPGYLKSVFFLGWILHDLLISLPREHFSRVFHPGGAGRAGSRGSGRAGRIEGLLLDLRFSLRSLLLGLGAPF